MEETANKKSGKKGIGSVFNKKNLLLTFNIGNAISKFYPDSLKDTEEMMIKDILIVLFTFNKRTYLLHKYRFNDSAF